MNNRCVIKLEDAVARNPLVRLSKKASFELKEGEHIALVGPNGAGKSMLVDMLLGKSLLREGTLTYDFNSERSNTAYDNIKFISFRDTYGTADANYYYQQRWNSQDADESPSARESLGVITNEKVCNYFLDLFNLQPLLDKRVVSLSSGELRKLQLTKLLQTLPKVLILDNPFIGLDANTRELLTDVLTDLSKNLQLILILSKLNEIPDFITHVVVMEDEQIVGKYSREEYLQQWEENGQYRQRLDCQDFTDLRNQIINLPYSNTNFTGDEVVKLDKVTISYDERTILKDLDWTVQRGEKWALSGENGAGKSTLLSLICADNPQSYACDISLFGRKRGTGESIWEIKKHIGYVSPEMHRAYLKNLPAIEIVASGLHDSIGLYKRPHADQMSVCEWWMNIFGVGALKDTPFLQMSSGEQRLVLLARAFVKDPELLILDEPLHGLDTYKCERVKAIIDAFAARKDKTMIMVSHYESELPASISHRIHLRKN